MEAVLVLVALATQGVQAIRRCKLVQVCQDFLGTRLVELLTNKGKQMRMVASLRTTPHPSDLHRPVKHDIKQARWDWVDSLHRYAAAVVKHSSETMFCKRAKRLRCVSTSSASPLLSGPTSEARHQPSKRGPEL